MNMFLADFVFSFELIVIALGLVLYHKARQKDAPPLKLASYILIIGGIIALACTVYFSFAYFISGDFASTAPTNMMPTQMYGGH